MPSYPELARRMNVSGKVKIEVVIAPDGRVKTTRVVVAHPCWCKTCQDALKEWKFVPPGSGETISIVECRVHNLGETRRRALDSFGWVAGLRAAVCRRGVEHFA